MRTWTTSSCVALLALLITGCATPGAASSTTFEAPVGATLSPLASARDQERGEPPAEGASLELLLDYATRHHPRLHAAHNCPVLPGGQLYAGAAARPAAVASSRQSDSPMLSARGFDPVSRLASTIAGLYLLQLV